MSRLQDLFEPLFQRVCTISRSAREGAMLDYENVRADVRRAINGVRESAGSYSGNVATFKVLEWPIAHCIDRIIIANVQAIASEWEAHPLSQSVDRAAVAEGALPAEQPTVDPDTRFFQLLDKDLSDRSRAAGDRIAIWHTCLCLYAIGRPPTSTETIHRYLKDLAKRLPPPDQQVCPKAYFTDPRQLPQRTARWLSLVAILLVSGLISVLVATGVFFNSSVSGLQKATDELGSNINRPPTLPPGRGQQPHAAAPRSDK